MKRKSQIFFVISISLLFTAFKNVEKEKKNDLDKAGLKGKVKYISTKSTYLNSLTVSVENIYYTQNGYKIEENYIGVEHTIYKRDERNNIIEEIREDALHKKIKKIFEYDIENNLIKKQIYDIDKGSKNVTEYKYDKKNNLIEIKGSTVLIIFKYKYDENSNIIEKTSWFNNSQSYSNKTTYNYDSKNNITHEQYSNKAGEITLTGNYKYDEIGNIIEVGISRDRQQFEIAYRSYDDKSNQIKQLIKNKDGSTNQPTIYHYVFDSQNNWIKMTSNNVISERTIEYYKTN